MLGFGTLLPLGSLAAAPLRLLLTLAPSPRPLSPTLPVCFHFHLPIFPSRILSSRHPHVPYSFLAFVGIFFPFVTFFSITFIPNFPSPTVILILSPTRLLVLPRTHSFVLSPIIPHTLSSF